MNITKTENGGYAITTMNGLKIIRNIELTREEADALHNFMGYEEDVENLRQAFSSKVTLGKISQQEADKALANGELVNAMIENIACGMSEWDMSYPEAFDAAFSEYFAEQ